MSHPLGKLLRLIAIINLGLQRRLKLLQRVFQIPQALEDQVTQSNLCELRLLLRYH